MNAPQHSHPNLGPVQVGIPGGMHSISHLRSFKLVGEGAGDATVRWSSIIKLTSKLIVDFIFGILLTHKLAWLLYSLSYACIRHDSLSVRGTTLRLPIKASTAVALLHDIIGTHRNARGPGTIHISRGNGFLIGTVISMSARCPRRDWSGLFEYVSGTGGPLIISITLPMSFHPSRNRKVTKPMR